MTPVLDLETLFDPLWQARLVRAEALARVQDARRRTDCKALHAAQRDARLATCSVVLLEMRHG